MVTLAVWQALLAAVLPTIVTAAGLLLQQKMAANTERKRLDQMPAERTHQLELASLDRQHQLQVARDERQHQQEVARAEHTRNLREQLRAERRAAHQAAIQAMERRETQASEFVSAMQRGTPDEALGALESADLGDEEARLAWAGLALVVGDQSRLAALRVMTVNARLRAMLLQAKLGQLTGDWSAGSYEDLTAQLASQSELLSDKLFDYVLEARKDIEVTE